MKYCRIDLAKTNYKTLSNSMMIVDDDELFKQCLDIYKAYCEYKGFESVMPIFSQEFYDPRVETLGYLDQDQLVAFSMVRRLDGYNVESLQFAWTYHKPKLRLGIKSIEHECALYKSRGFRYLYLGETDHYKTRFDGFELLGKLE